MENIKKDFSSIDELMEDLFQNAKIMGDELTKEEQELALGISEMVVDRYLNKHDNYTMFDTEISIGDALLFKSTLTKKDAEALKDTKYLAMYSTCVGIIGAYAIKKYAEEHEEKEGEK